MTEQELKPKSGGDHANVSLVCLLVGIGFTVRLLHTMFLVPSFISIFESFRQKLPLPTAILIGYYGIITVGIILMTALVVFIYFKVENQRARMGALIFYVVFTIIMTELVLYSMYSPLLELVDTLQ